MLEKTNFPENQRMRNKAVRKIQDKITIVIIIIMMNEVGHGVEDSVSFIGMHVETFNSVF